SCISATMLDSRDESLTRFVQQSHFNAKSKNVLGIFDPDKVEQKFEIEHLGQIYDHADQILQTATSYS
ncbi:MAG: hypothetical protein O2873_02565, partial [Proteobacteria bacterium]|nr:hypothetical protein [Pseudomonadota bacterium]